MLRKNNKTKTFTKEDQKQNSYTLKILEQAYAQWSVLTRKLETKLGVQGKLVAHEKDKQGDLITNARASSDQTVKRVKGQHVTF